MTGSAQHYKLNCPYCSGGIEIPEELIGTWSLCPHCQKDIPLDLANYTPPERWQTAVAGPMPTVAQTAPPAPRYAKIQKKTDSSGVIVQLIGLLCLPLLGLGLILIVVGGRMARKLICSDCGNKIDSQHVKMCPTCRAEFLK